jgi:AraC family transcriptional regulator
MQKLDQGEYFGQVAQVNKSNGLLASITTYHPAQFDGSRHYHSNAHFGFTIGGHSIEKKKETYHVVPGKITFYHAGEPHQAMRIIKPSLRVNLEIEQDFFSRFGITEAMVCLAADKNPDSKFLMIKIYRELLINDALTDTTNQMLFLQLVHHSEALENQAGIPGWVKVIRHFIGEHLDETITLCDLSQAGGVHPITISKHFPRYFHCTMGEYIRKLKIEKSLALIKSSGLSLTGLAYECGFFDQSHFTRTFKDLVGFLPTRYKMLSE